MYKTYKFRIYPNETQKILLHKSSGCIRFIYMDKKYKDLKEREHRCNVCNNKEDRDVNASINIMFEGLKLYMKEVFSIV